MRFHHHVSKPILRKRGLKVRVELSSQFYHRVSKPILRKRGLKECYIFYMLICCCSFKAHTQKTRIERSKNPRVISVCGKVSKPILRKRGLKDVSVQVPIDGTTVSKPILRKRGLKANESWSISFNIFPFQSPYSENED